MLGDVSGAFRRVPIHADAVHMFAFRFDGYIIIDLSCGFGWCGSPAFYALAGSLINELYATSGPVGPSPLDAGRFTGNVWCDDHTYVEIDTGTRCYDANVTLRRAMLTVLGPSAVNERKFTVWDTAAKSLGLLWDTAAGTVSIPSIKLEKAARLTEAILCARSVSKRELDSLLGVWRHIVVCFPPARAFYQRAQAFAHTFNAGRRPVPSDVVDDLRLFGFIVTHPSRFNGIPVAHFARLLRPTVHVYMDASDSGICVLEPTRREFIRHRFSTAERDIIQDSEHSYSINVRELQSAVLAAVHWGPQWRRASPGGPVVVRCFIDNTSAVAWTNHRTSRHPLAQAFLRLLSLAEFQFYIVMSAEHIAGKINTMADAGSRAWEPTDSLWPVWTDLSRGWSQVLIRPPYTDLSTAWDACCTDTHWPTLPVPSTTRTGSSGARSRAS